MQTTAIGTVANSLPKNKVILLTLLSSKRYSYCRIMQYICNTQMAKQGIFQENEEKNADFYVIKHISHKHFVSLQR